MNIVNLAICYRNEYFEGHLLSCYVASNQSLSCQKYVLCCSLCIDPQVLTGTYLNDIMKDVLSQTPTVPQFHTASLRSDRTQLATQRAYKPSDSGAFAHSSRTPVDNLEESLTQSLPADFCYRTHSQRLTADQKGIKNEVFVESYLCERWSTQTNLSSCKNIFSPHV